jgi:Cu(I)/Ag(I) efflux system membrane protein CusA/SilA
MTTSGSIALVPLVGLAWEECNATIKAAVEGATYRARPILMTVAGDVIGLLPIMWGAGTGSETMRRIAAPMVGGVLTATMATLIVIPVLFVIVHSRGLSLGEDIDE